MCCTCAPSPQAEDAAWALGQFGQAKLPDVRLNRRLTKLAAAMAAAAGESLPSQCRQNKDLVGAYRFLNNPRVEPHPIQQPHRELTYQACAQHPVVLCIQDTTELDFSQHPKTRDLGPIGAGKGFLQHTALAVVPDGELLGILHCRWQNRVPAPKGETRRQRLLRWRESNFWPETVHAVGRAPEGSRFITITDRGGDSFDTIEACEQSGHGFVIRAQHDRRVNGGTDSLWPYMKKQPVVMTRKIKVPARAAAYLKSAQPGREVTVAIRIGSVTLDPPRQDPRHQNPKRVNVVYVHELDPPQGDQEPVDWMLLTDEPMRHAQDAMVVLSWYEDRWIIEEWHRCQKEGCHTEQSQLRDREDLERLASMHGVIAVRLVQLRDLADAADVGHRPDRPRSDEQKRRASSPQALQAAVPWLWILVVAHLAHQVPEQLTAKMFWQTMAKQGGWQGRKCDGRPGWKTVWRGWRQMMLLIQGAQIQAELAKGARDGPGPTRGTPPFPTGPPREHPS